MAYVLFVVSGVFAYVGISIFGQLVNQYNTSAVSAFLVTLKPLPFVAIIVANMFFGLALYYGFTFTRFAIPALISIGVVTSFVYSELFLGGTVTLMRVIAVVLVILGIVLLSA